MEPTQKHWIFRLARWIAVFGYRKLGDPVAAIPPDLTIMKGRGDAFLYIGLHKSLWETSGALAPLHLEGLPIPFIGMGDNLVHGRWIHALASRCGVFPIIRPHDRASMILSARTLKADLSRLLGRGDDVVVYPEGTRTNPVKIGRYGDFFGTVFEAAIEARREHPERSIWIVPFNVDYSRVREDMELVADRVGRPRTLTVFDSLGMLRHLGRVYVSFGTPRAVEPHLDRKRLALDTRNACLELIRIQRVNVLATAFCLASTWEPAGLMARIEALLERLKPLKDHWEPGLETLDARAIWTQVGAQHRAFRLPEDRWLPLYALYGSYISHYLEQVGIHLPVPREAGLRP